MSKFHVSYTSWNWSYTSFVVVCISHVHRIKLWEYSVKGRQDIGLTLLQKATVQLISLARYLKASATLAVATVSRADLYSLDSVSSLWVFACFNITLFYREFELIALVKHKCTHFHALSVCNYERNKWILLDHFQDCCIEYNSQWHVGKQWY